MYISHFWCFFPLFLLLLLLACYIRVISRLRVVVAIHRQGVMTRKERGEDVYGCMLGQTLNMMKAVRRVIQSTVLKKEEGEEEEEEEQESGERCDSDGILHVT